MYCPQCGQQQVSEVTRFCSRCGFPLDGVVAVLASGGAVPTRYVQPGGQKLSPRGKGVRQGAMLMLSTLLIVPLTVFISIFMLGHPEIFVPVVAVSLFMGGLLRIFYALIMEDAAPPIESAETSGYASPANPQFERFVRNPALPPAPANPASSWRPRPQTAEIYQPPSITENPTRLLEKDEPKNR